MKTIVILIIILVLASCTPAPKVEPAITADFTVIQGEYDALTQKVILKLPENNILSGVIRKVPRMLIPEMEQVLLYAFVSNDQRTTDGELLLTTADIHTGSRGELRLSDKSEKYIVDFKKVYSR